MPIDHVQRTVPCVSTQPFGSKRRPPHLRARLRLLRESVRWRHRRRRTRPQFDRRSLQSLTGDAVPSSVHHARSRLISLLYQSIGGWIASTSTTKTFTCAHRLSLPDERRTVVHRFKSPLIFARRTGKMIQSVNTVLSNC